MANDPAVAECIDAPMHPATAQSLAMVPTKWQDLHPSKQILVNFLSGYLNSAVFTPGRGGQSYSQERVKELLCKDLYIN